MSRFTQTIAIALIVSVALCSASPARLDKVRSSRRKFARQEVAPEAAEPTPYPAAGFRPEVRFTLPTDEKLVVPDNTYLPPVGEPAKTYGPPDRTYLPPEADVKNEVEDVPSESAAEPEEPSAEEPQAVDSQSNEIPDSQSNEVPEEVKSVAVSGAVPPAQSSEEQPVEDVVDKDSEAEEIEEIIKEIEAEEDLISSVPQRIVVARNRARGASRARPAKLQVAPAQRRQSLVAGRPVYLVSRNGKLYKLSK